MRIAPSHDAGVGETRLAIDTNCYTDALPLLQTLIIRGPEIDLSAQSLALACAILLGEHIGDQLEVAGIRIGGDYAEAIERAIGRRVVVSGVDGLNRTISPGELDLYCAPAALALRPPEPSRLVDTAPFAAITWSGDFVDTTTRRSDGFALGQYFTNAALFAGSTRVSIALGLIHARDRCRTLSVPAEGDVTEGGLHDLGQALRIVGVRLDPILPAELPAPPAAVARARKPLRNEKGQHSAALSHQNR